MKEPVRRTHATLLLERSPPAHGGYAIALKLFKDFWSYFPVTLLSSHQKWGIEQLHAIAMYTTSGLSVYALNSKLSLIIW
ncbi:MAG: hypothetical protein ACYT04_45560 [Nostoc sp.]